MMAIPVTAPDMGDSCYLLEDIKLTHYVWTDHDVTKYSDNEPEERVDYTSSFYE